MPTGDEIEALVRDHKRWSELYGDDPQAVGWSSRRNAQRLNALLRPWEDALMARTLKIVDLGCGLGHLADVLISKGVDFEYLGLDINPELIARASRRHPSLQFRASNFMDETIDADLIVSAGMLNRKFADSRDLLSHLLRLCQSSPALGASLNFLSAKAIARRSENFYVHMGWIDDEIDRSLTSGFVLDGDTLPGELIVYFRRVGEHG